MAKSERDKSSRLRMKFTASLNLIFGLSEKSDGPMKNNLTNQRAFFERKNLNTRKIINVQLTHGNNVLIIDSQTEKNTLTDCDALITVDKNCLLTLTVADCLPIYFYDQQKQVVALAHAGWKGVLNGIAQKTVLSLINNFNCNPADIKIFIGPHIQKCHFEVQDDVASQFASKYVIKTNGKKYIKLANAVKDQLIKTGILANNISISPECTYCLNNKYFSWRREHDKILKTMIAYIGLN